MENSGPEFSRMENSGPEFSRMDEWKIQGPSSFFWLGAAWVKPRADRPSVSEVNGQLHIQIGCKLRIKRTRRIETSKQGKTNSELKQKVSN